MNMEKVRRRTIPQIVMVLSQSQKLKSASYLVVDSGRLGNGGLLETEVPKTELEGLPVYRPCMSLMFLQAIKLGRGFGSLCPNNLPYYLQYSTCCTISQGTCSDNLFYSYCTELYSTQPSQVR